MVDLKSMTSPLQETYRRQRWRKVKGEDHVNIEAETGVSNHKSGVNGATSRSRKIWKDSHF